MLKSENTVDSKVTIKTYEFEEFQSCLAQFKLLKIPFLCCSKTKSIIVPYRSFGRSKQMRYIGN